MTPDEGPSTSGNYGPYVQSERLPLYEHAVEQLIDSEAAYRCFCSEDVGGHRAGHTWDIQRLALLKKDAARRGMNPKYDRRCMNIDKGDAEKRHRDGESNVVRLRLDVQKVTFEVTLMAINTMYNIHHTFQDMVFGSITQTIDETDAVMSKSDGYPTYHLANVVDDKHMDISHVIRGSEWISSTGKHMILYK